MLRQFRVVIELVCKAVGLDSLSGGLGDGGKRFLCHDDYYKLVNIKSNFITSYYTFKTSHQIRITISILV